MEPTRDDIESVASEPFITAGGLEEETGELGGQPAGGIPAEEPFAEGVDLSALYAEAAYADKSGFIDPADAFRLAAEGKITRDEAMELSGIAARMREAEDKAREGHEAAKRLWGRHEALPAIGELSATSRAWGLVDPSRIPEPSLVSASKAPAKPVAVRAATAPPAKPPTFPTGSAGAPPPPPPGPTGPVAPTPAPAPTSDPFLKFFQGSIAAGVGSMLPGAIGPDIMKMVTDHNKQLDTTGAVYIALCMTYMIMPGAIFMKQSDFTKDPFISITARTRATDGTVTAVTTPYAITSIETIPESEEKVFGILLTQALVGARRWLLDLTACWQVRPLKAANVQGYFQSMNGTTVRGAEIVPFFNAVKNSMDTIMENDQYRALLSKNKFMKYHTSSSSTAGLVKRAVQACRSFIAISPVTAASVNSALSRYWDLNEADKIPRNLVAFAHAYLSAAKSLPENWYQGNAARDEIGDGLYLKWRETAKRWIELTQNLDAIREAKDLDSLWRVIAIADRSF